MITSCQSGQGVSRDRDLSAFQAEFERNDSLCNRLVGLFQLISHKPRFRIICLLDHGDFCVGDIADVVNQGSISSISQQLKILTLAGVISKRRDAQKIIYHLEDPNVREILRFMRKKYMVKNGKK